MSEQLPSTSDITHLQISTSVHTAHRNLSNFLSKIDFLPPPPPPGVNGNEPMEVGDDEDEAEPNAGISIGAIDKVEEKMRDCYIKNKRSKRPLSPSTAAAAAAAEERRFSDDDVKDFDARAARLRALDLVHQNHG